MKRIIIFVITFLISLNVYAVDIPACTESEMARLKELANNVQFKKSYEVYEYEDDLQEVEVFYKFNIINYDADLRIFYKTSSDDNDDIEEIDPKVGLDFEFNNIQNVTFYIRAYTTNMCTNELLKKVTVELPDYNDYYYYHKDKCKDNPEFKYCKEFMSVNLSDEEIDKLFEEYINNNKVETPKKDDNLLLIIISSGIVGVVIIVIIIYIIIRKKKKDDI